MRTRRLVGGVACFLVPVAILIACGDTTLIQIINADSGVTSPPSSADDASVTSEASTSDAPNDAADAATCATDAGLGCKLVDCGATPKTSLRGKVYDPQGANPLPNVTVYFPGGDSPETLPPIADSLAGTGITCAGAAACTQVVGALRIAKTNSTGEFVLDDVPVGVHLPLVIQIGKWRRLVYVDTPTQCIENIVPDKTIRLPRNTAEGNLPHIGVGTGGFDAFECLMRSIGVDTSEFVQGDSNAGHIHLFKGKGGGLGTPAEDWWNDSAKLRHYDAVLLSCEGEEALENKGGGDAGARGSIGEYLDSGGKVIASHYHYVWFKNSPSVALQGVATWGSGSGFATGYSINTTFPEGQRMFEWLTAVNATVVGKIPLESVTNSAKAVTPPTVSWIGVEPEGPKVFSFNTPINAPAANQCGRGVFADVHVTATAGPTDLAECPLPTQMTPSQKAMEFMLFSLAECNQ